MKVHQALFLAKTVERSTPDTLTHWAGSEIAQNISSGFVEQSLAILMIAISYQLFKSR